MSTALAVQNQPSVIQYLADSYGMDKAAFVAALKSTVVPGDISDAQLAAFCLVAKQYQLNPITKEIYAFPRKGGGVQPIVGIDGWCNIINSNPQLDGIEFEDHMVDGKLSAITCRISRKDRSKPVECIEYMEECKRDSEPWKKWPARMLRHKALIQCARYAFSLSGIVDQDEAERMEMIDVTPMVKDPVTGESVKASASPFKKANERKEYCTNVKDSIAKASSLEELEVVKEMNKPKLDAMQRSGNDYDQIGVEDILLAIAMAEKRIMIATRETSAEQDEAEMERQIAEEERLEAERIGGQFGHGG